MYTQLTEEERLKKFAELIHEIASGILAEQEELKKCQEKQVLPIRQGQKETKKKSV